MNSPRIAWLLTSAFYYWHPMLSCLTQRFPETQAFAAKWQGYAAGFENQFAVEVVGKRKIVSLKQSTTGYGSSFTFLSLSIVERLLRFKPDVVFSNSFGVWTILALLFKSLGKWRVVIAYEGSSPSVDYRSSPLRLAIRRLMVRSADASISNSTAGKEYLINILDAPKHRVFAHPYEVPCGQALRQSSLAVQAKTTAPSEQPIFLFVGSLKPRKGVHLLLDACCLLRQQGYQNYTLRVIGDGTQQQELMALTEQQGLTERVQWIGRVDYQDLGAYFQQADVFVLPTLEDTWGVVVLEAMALGKPALCSQWAGAAELIVEGKNGYCFDPQNPKELAEIMSRFMDDLDLAIAMGQSAQAEIAKYSPDAAAQFLAEVATFVLQPDADAVTANAVIEKGEG
jgi:glycosyltransferase involved in cell wall biosynthesis